LIRNSHALMTPPTRLARTAGIIQYRPPPAFSRKVNPVRASRGGRIRLAIMLR